MVVSSISALYASEISLSKTWCLGIIPRCFILASILRRAPNNSSSVRRLVILMSVQLESTWWANTWYCCRQLEQTGNCHVWFVYIVSIGWYTWMNISFFFSIGLLSVGCPSSLEIPPSRLKSVVMYCKPVASAGCGVFFFLAVLVVKRVFLCRLCIWPF